MTSVEPVVEQPEQVPMQAAAVNGSPQTVSTTGAWNSTLCGCCSDVGSCCLGLFCVPILGCLVSSKMGECCCVGCVSTTALRTKYRTQQDIEGSVCKDCLASSFCFPCVLCQLSREIKRTQPTT